MYYKVYNSYRNSLIIMERNQTSNEHKFDLSQTHNTVLTHKDTYEKDISHKDKKHKQFHDSSIEDSSLVALECLETNQEIHNVENFTTSVKYDFKIKE